MTPLSSRALRSPVPRRALLAAAAGGLVAAGCNHRDRRQAAPYVVQPAPAPPAPEAPPPPPPDPRRLLSAASYEAGVGAINPAEPLAPTGRWIPTASGILVWVPQAVELVPGRAAELLAQVEATTSEPDTRLPLDARLPRGSRVIPLPGAFEVAGSGFPVWAVGLAGGQVWPNPPADQAAYGGPFSFVCWVSWRPAQSEPRLLPALAHEIRHLLTGDPFAGHVGGCCNRWAVSP